MQFYEEAWAGNLELMPGLMAEGHIQRDMVWQVRRFLLTLRHTKYRQNTKGQEPTCALGAWQAEPRVGRDGMTQGIENIRALYPDIAFRVLNACACPSSNKVGMSLLHPGSEGGACMRLRCMAHVAGVCALEHVGDIRGGAR